MDNNILENKLNQNEFNSEQKQFDLKENSLESSSNSIQDDVYFTLNCLSSKSVSERKNSTTKAILNSNDKALFNSEDMFLQKNNLFGTNVSRNYKNENQQSNELLSTDPNSVKVKKFRKSRSRKVLKLIEKSKNKNDKRQSIYSVQMFESKKEIEVPHKTQRRDIYGNVIDKKNKKKVKISFVDKVTNQPLVEVIEIESYRNYNYIYGMPKEEKIAKITSKCECCFIF